MVSSALYDDSGMLLIMILNLHHVNTFPVSHVANNDGIMIAVLVVVPSLVLSLIIFLAVIRYS